MSHTELVSDWISTTDAGPLLCGITSRSVRTLIVAGTRTPRGVIKLRGQHLGNRLFTRPAWIGEFLMSVETANKPASEPVATKS